MECQRGVAPASGAVEAGVADAGEGPATGVLAMMFLVRISSGGEVSSAWSRLLVKTIALRTGVGGCAAALPPPTYHSELSSRSGTCGVYYV